jgi:hypothetical protein
VSRVLVCNDCGDDVEVFEEPVEFTDPERFVCIRCLDERHAVDPPQLVLVREDAGPAPRQERRTYDPAQSRIPY